MTGNPQLLCMSGPYIHIINPLTTGNAYDFPNFPLTDELEKTLLVGLRPEVDVHLCIHNKKNHPVLLPTPKLPPLPLGGIPLAPPQVDA